MLSEQFDNSSVRDLVVSLRSLTSYVRAEDMERTNPSRWLSAGEASALLQSFMPNKLAKAWLDNDRKFDPAIPFSIRDGDVRYRSQDLDQFVRRCLAPNARVDFSERRARSDRRRIGERRRNPEIRLSPVAERRHAWSADRRSSIATDRRAVSIRLLAQGTSK